MISRANHDGSYDIKYDDGDSEAGAASNNIRSVSVTTRHAESDTIDADLKELRFQVQRAVDQGANLLDCFEYFDRDRSGDLDEEEFFSGLHRLGLTAMTRSEARDVMHRFPGRRRGFVKYADFIDGLKLRLPPHKSDDVDADLKELRFQVQRAVDQGANLLGCFEFFDRDRSGDLDEDEFYSGLRRLGLTAVTRSEARDVMAKFPGRRRGHIKYADFAEGLKLNKAGARKELEEADDRSDDRDGGALGADLKELRFQIQKAVDDGGRGRSRDGGAAEVVEACFLSLDRDRCGDVDSEDFGAALRKVGVRRLTQFEATHVEAEFPGRRRGTVNYRAFLSRIKLDGGGGRHGQRERGEGGEGRGVGSDRSGDVTLIAGKLREQLWEWASSYSKGAGGKTRSALKKVFKAFDKGGTGQVPRADMSALLQKKLKLNVKLDELDVLLDCLDVEGNGFVSYDEFVDFACYQPEGQEIGVLHELISAEVKRSGRDLLGLFQRYDEKRRGVVMPDDLRKVLKAVGCPHLNRDDLGELLTRFAFGGSSSSSSSGYEAQDSRSEVDYDLFVLWVGSGKDLNAAEQRVRTSLQGFASKGLGGKDYLQTLFAALDGDGSGFLDAREFRTAMSRLGLMLTEGEVRALYHRYDSSAGGKGLRYDDFLELANDSLSSLAASHACELLSGPVKERLGEWVGKHGAGVLRKAFSLKAELKSKAGGSGSSSIVSSRDFHKVVLKFKTLDLSAAEVELLRKCFELKGNPPLKGKGGGGDVDTAGLVSYHALVDFALHQSEDGETADLHALLCKQAAAKRGEGREALREGLVAGKHQKVHEDKKKKGGGSSSSSSSSSAAAAEQDGGPSTINFKSLERLLESALRLDLSRQDRRVLETRFDPSGRGVVDGPYFLQWVDVGIAELQAAALAAARTPSTADEEALVRGGGGGGGGGGSRFNGGGGGGHGPEVALGQAEVLCGRGLALLTESGKDFRRVFRALDKEGCGELRRSQFAEALAALGLPVGAHQARALGAKYAFSRRGDGDPRRRGSGGGHSSSSSSGEEVVVDYEKFLEAALTADPSSASFGLYSATDDGGGGDQAEKGKAAGGLLVSGALRAQLWDWFRSEQGGKGSVGSLLGAFRREDKALTGRVGKASFEKVVSSRLKMRLSKQHQKLLASCLEVDGEGQGVRYGDFVDFVAYEPEGGGSSANAWGELQDELLDGLRRRSRIPSGGEEEEEEEGKGGEDSQSRSLSSVDRRRESNSRRDLGGSLHGVGSSATATAPVAPPPRLVLEAFQKQRRHDPDREGFVSSAVFKRVLEDGGDGGDDESGPRRPLSASLGLHSAGLSASDVRDLARRFDVCGDGRVRYDLFARWCCAGHKLPPVQRKVKSGLKALVKATRVDPEAAFLKVLQAQAAQQTPTATSSSSPQRQQRERVCSRSDFCVAVAALGLLVNEGEVRALARHYTAKATAAYDGDNGAEGGASGRVEWGRFLDLALSEGDGGHEAGAEFELCLKDVGGNASRLALKFRSKVRARAARHPGMLAALFASLLVKSAGGEGAAGADDDEVSEDEKLDESSSAGSSEGGGGESGSGSGGDSEDDSTKRRRKKAAKTGRKAKHNKKKEAKKKKETKSKVGGAVVGGGRVRLGPAAFRRFLQAVGLRTGDRESEEALMSVFVGSHDTNGGGDTLSANTRKKNRGVKTSKVDGGRTRGEGGGEGWVGVQSVSLQVLGDFLFLAPGRDGNAAQDAHAEELLELGEDGDDSGDDDDDHDEFDPSLVKERRRRVSGRRRQGQQRENRKDEGEGGRRDLDSVGALLRTHLRRVSNARGSSAATAASESPFELLWRTFAETEQKQQQSKRAEWRGGSKTRKDAVPTLKGSLPLAAFRKALGKIVNVEAKSSTTSTSSTSVSLEDLATLEEAFLAVDKLKDRQHGGGDSDRSESETSREEEVDSGDSAGDASGSDDDEDNDPRGGGGRGRRKGGSSDPRGRSSSTSKRRSSRSPSGASKGGRAARSSSAASRLFGNFLTQRNVTAGASASASRSSSAKGGGRGIKSERGRARTRSGSSAIKKKVERRDGDEVCWVHLVCWVEAASPLQVLSRVRQFLHLKTAATTARRDDDRHRAEDEGSRLGLLNSKEVMVCLEDAATAAADRQRSDSNSSGSGDNRRHQQGRLGSPATLAVALRGCGLPLSVASARALFLHLEKRQGKGGQGWVGSEEAHQALVGESGGGSSSVGNESSSSQSSERQGSQGQGLEGSEWLEAWVHEWRSSLAASFELIWRHLYKDGGEGGGHHDREDDGGDHNDEGGFLVLEKEDGGSALLNALCHQLLKAVDPRVEPTKRQIKDLLKLSLGVAGEKTAPKTTTTKKANGDRRGNNGGEGGACVDKASLRKGLLDHVELEFRRRLARGLLTNGEVSWQAMAGFFALLDGGGGGGGCVTQQELLFVLTHKLGLVTFEEASELAKAAATSNYDADGQGGGAHVSLAELRALLLHAASTVPPTHALDDDDDAPFTTRERDHQRRALLLPLPRALLRRPLTPLAQSALLKINVGPVPKQEEYLNLAALEWAASPGSTSGSASLAAAAAARKGGEGLGGGSDGGGLVSGSCRPSVLASLDRFPKGKLGNAISGREALRGATGSSKSLSAAAAAADCRCERLMSIVQFKRAEGVPCPDERLVEGEHARGVRVCMFYAKGKSAAAGASGGGVVCGQETIVGNQYKTLAETVGKNNRRPRGGSGGHVNWAFPDDPGNGENDGRVLLSCDPRVVQEDMDLEEVPDLRENLFVLIELTMQVVKKNLRGSKKKERGGRSFDSSSSRSGSSSEGEEEEEGGEEEEDSESDGEKKSSQNKKKSSKANKNKKKISQGSKRSRKKGENGDGEAKGGDVSDEDGEESEAKDGNDSGDGKRRRRRRTRKKTSKEQKKGASTSKRDESLSSSSSSAEDISSREDDLDSSSSEDELSTSPPSSRRGRPKEGSGVRASASSSKETTEVTCGWVKVLLWDLCRAKGGKESVGERELTFEVRHGNPWGSGAGEPLPQAELKAQQNTVRHQLMDAMPHTLGLLVGKRRKCTLTLRAVSVGHQTSQAQQQQLPKSHPGLFGGVQQAVRDEINVFATQSLPTQLLRDVLANLPPNVVLPVGGRGCASLALFGTYCFALKQQSSCSGPAARGGGGTTGGGGAGLVARPLLSMLPDMMNEPAMRAALLGVWATHYYKRLKDFSSRLVGKPNAELASAASRSRTGDGLGGGGGYEGGVGCGGVAAGSSRRFPRLLEHLVPLLDDLVTDFWVVHKCAARFEQRSRQHSARQQQGVVSGGVSSATPPHRPSRGRGEKPPAADCFKYVGSYSTLREDGAESAGALSQRIERVTEAYLVVVLERARQRRENNVPPPCPSGQWYDEGVLPRGAVADPRTPRATIRALCHPQSTAAALAAGGSATALSGAMAATDGGVDDDGVFELHVPFDISELKFGVGITKYGGGYDPAAL